MATNEHLNNGKAATDIANSGILPDCAELEISRAGYELWRAAGRPVGRYLEFLALAERNYRQTARSSDMNRRG